MILQCNCIREYLTNINVHLSLSPIWVPESQIVLGTIKGKRMVSNDEGVELISYRQNVPSREERKCFSLILRLLFLVKLL